MIDIIASYGKSIIIESILKSYPDSIVVVWNDLMIPPFTRYQKYYRLDFQLSYQEELLKCGIARDKELELFKEKICGILDNEITSNKAYFIFYMNYNQTRLSSSEYVFAKKALEELEIKYKHEFDFIFAYKPTRYIYYTIKG